MPCKTIIFITETYFDKYHSQMISGAIKAAQEADINLVRLNQESITIRKQLSNQFDVMLDIIGNFHPDGIIFLGWTAGILQGGQEFISRMNREYGVPLLSVGIPMDSAYSVNMDGIAHFREIITHLTEVHQIHNILFVESFNPDSRLEEYRNRMQGLGCFNPELIIYAKEIYPDGEWVEHSTRARRIVDSIERKIEADVPVDAVISLYTDEAVCIQTELLSRGIHVPRDIKIASWEDGDRGRFATPSITSVYYPFYEQGYESVRIMSRLINGESVPKNSVVPGEFRIRQSCGCLAEPIRRVLESETTAASTASVAGSEQLKNELLLQADKFRAFEPVRLIDSLCSWIDEKKDLFLHLVADVIITNRDTGGFIEEVKHDLFLLRTLVAGFSPILSEEIKSLWFSCEILIGQFSEIETVSAFIEESDTDHMFQEINQGLISTLDMDILLDILEQGLKKSGVRSGVISLHDEHHSPFSAQSLLFCYNGGERITVTDDLKTKNDNYIETLLDSQKPRNFFVNLLHLNDELVGYILFEPGPHDVTAYSGLAVQVGSAIHSINTLNRLQDSNLRLETAREKIMSSMQIIKEKTAALEESNRELSQLDILKNDFIANITHDFRSPLSVIINSLELALSKDDLSDRETTVQRYNTIMDATVKLKDSIDRLLDLARIDAGGMRLKIEKIDICAYIKGLIEYYQSATQLTEISVEGVLPKNEIPDFYSDLDKIEEIIHNIVSNALKFTDKTEGKIVITLSDQTDSILITIEDNGIGIPRDKHDKIFERFVQLDKDDIRRHKGTGIGLAFAKQLVELLAGDIRVESEGPGKGSRFIVTLKKGTEHFKDADIDEEPHSNYTASGKRPVYERMIQRDIIDDSSRDSIEKKIAGLNEEGEFEIKKCLILIIDDEPDIRNIIREYLEMEGYANFILANNGLAGIDAAYEHTPDIIITDFNMPKMRGDEFHDTLLSNPEYRHIPVIFLTAVIDRGLMIERKKKGAIAYIGKPIDSYELVATVENGLKKYLAYKQLLQQASTDALTGLNNKKSIQSFLNERLHLRSYYPLSIIFIDIDHFKQLNDTFGHQAGDHILEKVAGIISQNIRTYDKAGRFGGEEFLLVLPETTIREAVIAAEKIRSKVEKRVFTFNTNEIMVTASFGVSSLIENAHTIEEQLGISDLESLFHIEDAAIVDWKKINRKKAEVAQVLVELADKAMYRAKSPQCTGCGHSLINRDVSSEEACPHCSSLDIKRGRNRVVAYDDM